MARAPRKGAATKDEDKNQGAAVDDPKVKAGKGSKTKANDVAKAEKEKPTKKVAKKEEAKTTSPKANGKTSPKTNGAKASPKANGKAASLKANGKSNPKTNGKTAEPKAKAPTKGKDAKKANDPPPSKTTKAKKAGKKNETEEEEEPVVSDQEPAEEEVEETATEDVKKGKAKNAKKTKADASKPEPKAKKAKAPPAKADKKEDPEEEEEPTDDSQDEEEVEEAEATMKKPEPAKRGRKRQAEPTKAAAAEAGEDREAKKAKIVVERQSALGQSAGSCLALGQGDTGQLGLGEDIMERAKPALVNSIPAKVASVVAGGMHSLALTVDGVVYSFGCNDEGALGRAIEEDEEGFTPGEVRITGDNDAPLKIVQISAGDSHSVALGENGKAYYWGTFRDSSGSFGLTPDGAMQKLPVALAHNLDVAKISSGAGHVALLTTGGELYTLGCGEQGQLGRVGERFTARGGRRGIALLLEPDRVHSKNRRAVFTDVWAGSYDTLALTEKNEVLACGLNNYNQLGISKGMLFHTLTKSSGLSNKVQGPAGGGKWSQIVFGQHHALCLDDEGRVYSVGRAEYGRLGLGQMATDDGKADAKVPTLVPALEGKKCVEVGCGACVSFAVTEDGECYSWGMGTNGQLGHGDEEDAWEPVAMPGKQLETRSVVGVSGGGQHTLLIAKDK